MPITDVGALSLSWEISGPKWGEPLVLLHGLGAQLIDWHPGLVLAFETAGFRVVRLDNRDQGLSGSPSDDSEYAIGDMSEDVVALLDRIGISRAHLVGISMGALIAQECAAAHPDRVLSQLLVATMSAPAFDLVVRAAADRIGSDDGEVLPSPASRSEIVQQTAEQRYRVSGTGLSLDWVRKAAAESYDRAHRPEGVARQLRAVRNYGDRLEALANTVVPTTIVHGRDDVIVDFESAVALARVIPGADLHLFAEIGHEIPPAIWPDIVGMAVRNVQRRKAREVVG